MKLLLLEFFRFLAIVLFADKRFPYTRRRSWYYKIPSLVGVWYRIAFINGGNLANLEDMFDPKRLLPFWPPPYVYTRASLRFEA